MLIYIRYTLAALCLTACVGCLALWIGTISSQVCYLSTTWFVRLETEGGTGSIIFNDINPPRPYGGWRLNVFDGPDLPWFADQIEEHGQFGTEFDFVYFPLWYPAIVFALAGVGVLRFRRQFCIRSAMIATTIVAALIGMTVIL